METNRRKIVARLEREGWEQQHGGSHDLFINPAIPGEQIVVPRHREVSIGVARKIAKQAKWHV